MTSMKHSTMAEIAHNGTVEDFINLLTVAGDYVVTGTEDRWLDEIMKEAVKDKNEVRKAKKVTLVAAYDAHGVEGLKDVTFPDQPALKTLKDLAFNSSAEELVKLIKAQKDNAEALQTIVESAQKDCKRRHFLGEKRARREEKKAVLFNFFAKSGPFAPDAPDQQDRIAELEAQLETLRGKVEDSQPKRLSKGSFKIGPAE